MNKKSIRENKCEGRFNEFRDELSDALSIVENELNSETINDIFSLVSDMAYVFDAQDNYFTPGNTEYRMAPNINDPNSILPLLAKDANYEPSLVGDYLKSIDSDISSKVLDNLSKFGVENHIAQVIKDERKLIGYDVVSNFGIGSGENDSITSDAPFNIELWKTSEDTKEHVLTVGFWYRRMADSQVVVVDQIQNTRSSFENDNIYAEGLEVTANVAEELGLDEMWVVSAKNHPMFKLHPERRSRMTDDLKIIYNDACEKLKFDGDAETFYVKKF